MPLTFRKQDRDRVAGGEITVTFRLWKHARVKAGNSYQTGLGVAEIDDVQAMPAAVVSVDDVRPSGCQSIEAIWRLAGEHTNTVVTRDTLLYRVAFHMRQTKGAAGAA